MWRRARGAAAAGFLLAAAAAADPLAIDAAPVASGPGGAAAVGALSYRGGLHLRSDDPRFGGVSGLSAAADGGAFVAITDSGHWVVGALVWRGGRLAGVADARILPLRDAAGAAFADKRDGDAEALARAPQGGWLVAFERRHRLLRYAAPGGPGAPPGPAPDLSALPPNRGVEALATLDDGALFVLAEADAAGGRRPAWTVDGGALSPFDYPAHPFFRPSGAARLPDGRIAVLERGYAPAVGVKARLMLLDTPAAGAAPREVARFEAPLTVDNFEAVSAFRAAGGETVLLLASDDNFNPDQRTLLLSFALAERRAVTGGGVPAARRRPRRRTLPPRGRGSRRRAVPAFATIERAIRPLRCG